MRGEAARWIVRGVSLGLVLLGLHWVLYPGAPKTRPLAAVKAPDPASPEVANEGDGLPNAAALADPRREVLPDAASDLTADTAPPSRMTPEGLKNAKPSSTSTLPRPHIADSTFAVEYGLWSDSDLAAEFARVQAEFTASQAAAFEAEFAAGNGTFLSKDETGKPMLAGFSNEEIYTTRTRSELPGEVELVVLEFGRYSQIYQTSDRFFWLMKEINRRK